MGTEPKQEENTKAVEEASTTDMVEYQRVVEELLKERLDTWYTLRRLKRKYERLEHIVEVEGALSELVFEEVERDLSELRDKERREIQNIVKALEEQFGSTPVTRGVKYRLVNP